jgi:hypothetical protein
MHRFESKLRALTYFLPNMLLVSEMIREALAHQRHPAESCWVCYGNMSQDFDYHLGWGVRNRARKNRVALK